MEKSEFLFLRSDNKRERINVFYYTIERTTPSNDRDISGMTQLNGLQSRRIWRFKSLKIGRKKCHPMETTTKKKKRNRATIFVLPQISITIYGNDEAFHLNSPTLFIVNSDSIHAPTTLFPATASILFRNAIGCIISIKNIFFTKGLKWIDMRPKKATKFIKNEANTFDILRNFTNIFNKSIGCNVSYVDPKRFSSTRCPNSRWINIHIAVE